MAGIDAGFLAMETSSQHMHTLKVALLDVSGAAQGYSFDHFREVLFSRLDRLPPFRRRVIELPGRVHHPVWVEDPDFDLDAHVHRVRLPSPGTREQLDDVISSIASERLDRRRPLWDLSVVEGLASGEVAFVAKLHHCIADGVTAAELLVGVLDREPHGDEDPPSGEDAWSPEPLPSRRRLLVDALYDSVRGLARVPMLIARTMRGLGGAAKLRRRGGASAPLPFATPSLPFNRSITGRRRFVSATLPLPEVKMLREDLGCTVNDVVLAICTGALRRYLSERDELPGTPLVASIPVAVGSRPSGRRAANNVSNLFAPLPVQVDDPLARVAEIHVAVAAAKKQLEVLGPELLAEWSEITPPLLFGAVVRAYSRLGLANLHRPAVNLVVSNVRGPSEPLWIAGARVVEIWSVGPILENAGLNITVWSYLDRLGVGILACDDRTPDVGALAGHLDAALAELRAAASRTT